MVIEDAALLNRPVTQVTPAALFSRRLHTLTVVINCCFPQMGQTCLRVQEVGLDMEWLHAE